MKRKIAVNGGKIFIGVVSLIFCSAPLAVAAEQGSIVVRESERQFQTVEWGRTLSVFGKQNVGAKYLKINITEYAPGTAHTLHRHPNQEEVIYILDGEGYSKTKAGEKRVRAGAFVFIPSNTDHATFNSRTDRPMRAIIMKAPPDESGSKDEDPTSPGSSVVREDEREWEKVEWGRTMNIFGKRNVGARLLKINITEYAPGTAHTPHRHPGQEEVICVLEGEGITKTKAGEKPISARTFVYVPPDTDHATINVLSDRPMRAIIIKSPHEEKAAK